MRLEEFFNTIYAPQRLLGRSENTTRLYLISIRNFSKTLGHRATFDDLTDTAVAAHMQRMINDGRAKATANKDRAQLLTLWRHAHRLGMIDRYPMVQQLVEPERTPNAWLPDELDKLFAAIEKQEGYFGDVPRSLWWRTLIMFCLDTGERISAVRQAQWSWFSGKWVDIPAEARKGNRRDRSYRLSDETLGHLMAIQMVSPKEPFPWPHCSVYLWRKFGDLLKSAGLPAGRRDKFHRLRRTTASVVHSAGLDAQSAMDHQYSRTTKKYLDPRFRREKEPCDALSEFLANPKLPNQRKQA